MSSDDPSSTSQSPPPAAGRSEALVVQPTKGPLADDVQMQRLWLSLQLRPWRSLVLVGASKGVGTLGAANQLAKIAWWYTGQPTAVFDMRDLSLRLLEHQLREMASEVQGAERVFIAVRSTAENPTAAPLARAADCAALCVELGRTDARSAQKTLDEIGRSHFIGTLLVPARSADEEVAAPRAEPPPPEPDPGKGDV